MNFFRIKTSWSNAEFIVLKLCIASAYVLIGAYFSDFLLGFVVPLVAVFAVTVVLSVYLWLKKMKNRTN